MNNKELRSIALLGTILCLLAVLIGAFGAHAFKGVLAANQREDVFDLANRYQFYHGLALILIAALFAQAQPKPRLVVIVGIMFLGTLIFCGSLYLLALLNLTWLGAVTPIGGALLLVSWGLLATKLLRFG
jgi:uncharacterized membrane protein YgdD (TMEM256/DUF423 family)